MSGQQGARALLQPVVSTKKLPRYFPHWLQVGDASAKMSRHHREDRFVAKSGQRPGGQLKVAGAQVAGHGRQPAMQDRHRDQRTGIGGNDDAAPRAAQLQRGERDDERRSAGALHAQARRGQEFR